MAKASLFLLKAILVLILCCWISLWILKPTEIWTRKWKQVEDKATKTVFGYNSVNFAVYTFPFLGLAIFGLFYLELKSERHIKRRKKSLISGFSKPLLVGPAIGILSAVEILCVALFAIFLSWTFYTRISYDFKKLMPYKLFKLSIWQFKVFKIAVRCGLLAEACLALLLLPILRRMSVFKLLGVQFEASVRYHVWLGTATITFTIIHGLGVFLIWGVKNHIQDEMWKWQRTGRIYLAGEIAFVAGLVILITSLPQIRRRNFEIFYYTHHLYLVFLVFFLFHAGDKHFYMVFPGIFLFGLDKLLSILQSRPRTCIISARVFPCKAVELTLPKDPKLDYTPTSTIFMKIPSISKLQWHPFSITSSSKVDKHTISVIIRNEQWWTSSLYNLVLAKSDEEADHTKSIPVAVEGPYGPPSLDFLRYESILLVAGGIGITPLLSILQEITFQANDPHKHQLPSRIDLIYAVKKSLDISLLNPVLPQLLNARKFNLKLKVFVTREVQSGTDKTLEEILTEVSQIQAIIFDTPISSYAIFGVENSRYLAAILGLSSILFLLFLLCFNQTLLHPAKRPSKQKTPSSVADAYLLCSFALAIICTGLLAFFLRWKRLKKEIPSFTKLTDQSTKTSTAGIDKDVEDHQIYFGRRPNFEEELSNYTKEIGGSKVGVFVCGPETMKESVASACKLNTQASRSDARRQKQEFCFHSLNFTL